jgi:hypothetical protein
MISYCFPKIREDEGYQAFPVSSVVTSKEGIKLHKFLEIEIDGPEVVVIGGLFYYNRNVSKYCLTGTGDYESINLLDSYTHTRIFPHRFEGKIYVSSYYVGLPILYAQKGEKSFGFTFQPFLKTNGSLVPFFFHYSYENGKLKFSVNGFEPFTAYVKSDKAFTGWREGGWEAPREISWTGVDDRLFKTQIFYKRLDAILRKVCGKSANVVNIDTDFIANKARRHLLAIWEEKNGVFAASNSRFAKKTFELTVAPLFDTLLSNVYLLGKAMGDEYLSHVSKKYKETILSDDASVSFPEGFRVWNNIAGFNRRLLFSNIYNTGVGGFPGGQATIVRSLLARFMRGDADPRLLNYGLQGAEWLRGALFGDGHWARSYVLPKMNYSATGSDTGEDSLSIGANAEGSSALFLAYEASRSEKYLHAARKALDFVNRFSMPWPLAFGYLRDNKMREADGISSVFAISANLKAYRLLEDKAYLDAALRWGWYLMTWVRIWKINDLPVDWSMDPLISSFKPRVSSFETALAASAALELFEATKDEFWLKISENIINRINVENSYLGYSEGLYISLDKELKSVPFESSYATSAVVEWLLKYNEIMGRPFPKAWNGKIQSVIYITNTPWRMWESLARRSINKIRRIAS